MYLVTESKRQENQLGYSMRTKEYVYFHDGIEKWRMEGDTTLLDYFNEIRTKHETINEHDIQDNIVWRKYIESCSEYERPRFR